MLKYNRLRKLDKYIFKIINDLYKNNNKVIRETLTDVGKEAFENSTKFIDDKEVLKPIKKELKLPINDRNAGLKWTERQAYNRNDVTYKVQMDIKASLERGDNYAQMAKQLGERLGKDVYKSNMIVRTESRRVYSTTTLETGESLEKAGIKMDKVWHTLADERVRSSHQAMDGQRVPVDEMFTLPSGVKTMGPGLSGVPDEDIWCRCYIELIPSDLNI